MQVTTIGLDIAKHVFQVHGIDRDGTEPRRVWMPPGMQAVSVGLGHAIGCGRVSGLVMRPLRRRGPVWR